jgi:peptide/nickel transport system substrate-binding protein
MHFQFFTIFTRKHTPNMSKILAPVLVCSFLLTAFWSCRNVESTRQAPKVDYQRTSNEAVVAMRSEPDVLNPVITTTSNSRQIFEMMFQYLMDIDPQDLVLRPQLVKSKAEVRDITDGPYAGGASYTFEIREEAVWDDGRPVTAQDYVFAIKASLNPKVQAARVRAFLTYIKDIEIDAGNPKRFTVFTSEKDILGEESIVWSVPLLPEHIYDRDGLLKDIPISDFTDPDKIERLAETNEALGRFAEQFSGPAFGRDPEQISGSGPYRLVSWDAGQQLMLVRKENWWGDRLPAGTSGFEAYPDTLTFVIIPNEETAVAALRAEEIDVLSDIGPENFEDLKNTEYTAERYQFASPPILGHYFLYLNNNQPQLADKRVRRAMAHLVNVDDILETYYLGYGQRHAVPVLSDAAYYDDELKPVAFDVERAKALLSEAGWKDSDGNGILDKQVNGERLEMKISYLYPSNSERAENIGLLIKDDAIKAGVEIEMVPEESNLLLQRTKTGDYSMALAGKTISPTLWNPKQLWHTNAGSGGDNRTGFGNAETDRLIDEILVTLDEQKRNEMYKQMQRIIYDEQPVIFLFILKGRLVVHKRFDFEVTPIVPGLRPNELKINL